MKAAFYTLGCKVNQYETESMREQFRRAGFNVVPEDEAADVYVINTCTVTNMADRKSRQFIRKAHKLNPGAVVAVTGCYAQMDKEKVASIEGVDIVTGTDEKSKILQLVKDMLRDRETANTAIASDTDSYGDKSAYASGCISSCKHGESTDDNIDIVRYGFQRESVIEVKPYDQLNKYEELGVISEMEGRTRAFIKIQEGCDRFCSYCIIPFARGKVRSRARDEIVQEVRGLIGCGYKEIVLTGINTALYGTDLGYGGIAPLIKALDDLQAVDMSMPAPQIPEDPAHVCLKEQMPPEESNYSGRECGYADFRIRLSSLEPTVVDADYAAGLLKYSRLCHHLHLSAQSGSDSVLAGMNRHYTHEDYLEIVRRLREQDPYYGISADIIVGFPGETEEDFRRSIDLVRESELIKTHVFKYSVRRGTRAASMPDQIDEKVKNRRSRVLIEAAEETARAFCEKCIGQVRRVLFEQEEHGMITGYTDNYIKVYVPAGEPGIRPGEFADVRLAELYKEGMIGESVNSEEKTAL